MCVNVVSFTFIAYFVAINLFGFYLRFVAFFEYFECFACKEFDNVPKDYDYVVGSYELSY